MLRTIFNASLKSAINEISWIKRQCFSIHWKRFALMLVCTYLNRIIIFIDNMLIVGIRCEIGNSTGATQSIIFGNLMEIQNSWNWNIVPTEICKHSITDFIGHIMHIVQVSPDFPLDLRLWIYYISFQFLSPHIPNAAYNMLNHIWLLWTTLRMASPCRAQTLTKLQAFTMLVDDSIVHGARRVIDDDGSQKGLSEKCMPDTMEIRFNSMCTLFEHIMSVVRENADRTHTKDSNHPPATYGMNVDCIRWSDGLPTIRFVNGKFSMAIFVGFHSVCRVFKSWMNSIWRTSRIESCDKLPMDWMNAIRIGLRHSDADSRLLLQTNAETEILT